jgi:hypothetical protein
LKMMFSVIVFSLNFKFSLPSVFRFLRFYAIVCYEMLNLGPKTAC